MNKYLSFACLFAFLISVDSFACVMVPSVWKTINSFSEELQSPTAYSLNEAFAQFKRKLDKELKVCNIPNKPLWVRSLLSKVDGKLTNKETFLTTKESLDMIFSDAIITEYDNLPKDAEVSSQLKVEFDDKYSLDLYISDSKRTCMNMIDLNMQVWALLHLVIRDETSVYVRVSDKDENTIFIDEFEVSPTIVTDVLITPKGGFFKAVERNNYKPVHIDWGSVGDSKEHVLRINTSFYAPNDFPPLEEFKSDIVKGLEKEERESACKQLVYAIKAEDTSLMDVIFDTYPTFTFGIIDDVGKAPIHYAVLSNSEDIVKKLIERKVLLDLTDNSGNNALHLALMNEKVSLHICELLVRAGLDKNLKNNEGKTPLDLAIQKNIHLDY